MITNAMVLAAGNGTRLHPLTLTAPKPLLQVGEKPIIEYNLDLLKKYGITNICVNTCYLSNVMSKYFSERKNDGLNIYLNVENKMMGSAGGVKNLQSKFTDTFIVVSGDLLTNFDISEMFEFHKSKRSHVTMGLTTVEDPRQYGIVVLDEGSKIIKFLEKPKTIEEAFSNLINIGVYIIEPYILDFIPKDEFFDFSKDLFPILLNKGIPFYGYTIDGYWRDLGTVEQLRMAEKDIINNVVK